MNIYLDASSRYASAVRVRSYGIVIMTAVGKSAMGACGKSFLEKNFPQHQLECELKRCWQCKKSCISKKEFPQHLQLECGKKYCWKCGKAGILEKEFPRH
jgi:hypothetical protein